MITVVNRVSTSAQEMLNELETVWNWAKVVHDETATENVTQLWATNKVYLELNGKAIDVKSTDGFSTTCGGTSSTNSCFEAYTLVVTDNAVMVTGDSYSNARSNICVGKITDGTTESVGIAATSGTASALPRVIYTDDMTVKTDIAVQSFIRGSVANTQLVPVYPPYSQHHFSDVFWSFVRCGTLTGKAELGGERYYVGEHLSLRYTE